MMRWVTYFRTLLITVKLKSKDDSIQIGVIVGKDKEIVSTGYNFFHEV